MSNIYENTSNINNVSTSQRKRIFSNVTPQSQNILLVPKYEQQKFSLNSLHIDPELSYIAPAEMEQKQTSKIEEQIRSELRQEQISQQDPAKQSLLKDVQLENLENILTLFRSTVPLNQSHLQGSRIANSTTEPQFYQQLEADAENIRDQIKKEGRTVHTIIEKQNRVKQQKQNLTTQLNAFQQQLQKFDTCTSLTKFQKEIRYTFNQFESKSDELRDLFNESFNFMSVVSVAAYEKLQQPFNEFETISDSEFTSYSLKLFSLIEMQAKEFEITLSEKRRLGNINQNHQQYKQACQRLLQLTKSYPEVEQNFITQIIHLQRIASIYFKGLSLDVQNNLQHYQILLQDYRVSLAMIEKISMQKEVIKDHFDSFDYYSYLIFYLNQQPQNYQDNYQQLKYQRDELRKIEYKQTKYFTLMKNKVYHKCCLYVETIQHQVKIQKSTVKQIIPLIDIYLNYKSQDYKNFFDVVCQNLKQNITKELWLHLINLFQEIQNQKFKLKQVLLKLKEINQHHPTLSEFKERFIKLINNELLYINTLTPIVQPYLGIHDIDAHIQYIQFKQVYENQKDSIYLKIQEIIQNLQQQLLLTDIDNQNLRKIAIEKQFSQIHQLEQTASKLQKKKVQAEIDQIKIELQQHLIFEKDVICLLEQMQYLHRGNLQMIIEDFSEIDQRNNNSSLQQLIEVTTESYKKIEGIKDERLLEVKQVQVQGFKWILNLFQQFDNYRKNLVELIFQNQDEQQIEFQRTIQLINYEEFIQQNRFSHLFYYLNQYPRKYQHWIQIKNELSKVMIQSFKMYQKKVMDKIDILGGDKPLALLQFDQDNIEKILRWFALEQHHSQLAKGIILFQGYRKIKVQTQQFSQQNQSSDTKSKLMVDLQSKMFDITNKLRDQFQELKSEIKFALHTSVESLIEDEFDKLLYTELQEEWVIDYLEKGVDFSFLVDFQNNLGVFEPSFLSQSLIFLNINQILKTQSEIDVKEIRSTLLNAIKHQT